MIYKPYKIIYKYRNANRKFQYFYYIFLGQQPNNIKRIITKFINLTFFETLIELFGTARCMFASNFPVDKVCASFDEIYGGFEKIVASFTEQEKDMLFRSNANRIYAMGLE